MASIFISRLNQEAIRRSSFILLPLLVLFGDILWFPVIFEGHRPGKNVSVVSLVADQVIWLGTLKAHQIYVSIDTIRNGKYLSYVEGSSNALVISHFVDSESPGSTAGALGQAVLEKLRLVSPDDNRGLRDLFDQADRRRPGEILELALNVPREQYHRFPIDHLFILLFEQDPSRESKDVISKGIAEVLERAGRENISMLIIPCLAYNWEDKNSVQFDDFFGPVFDSLSVASAPRDIYLSLYTDWPTFTLEEAVISLNWAWEKHSQGSYGRVPVLYRGDFRLTLLLLPLCLLVSSFYTPLTVKNFLIIACSFIGSAAGSGKIIDFVTQGHDATFYFFVQVFVLIVLAVGLPFFVDWNPKNIFSKDRS